jgi:hypothetical protein
VKTPEEMAYDYGEKFDGVEISKNDINIAWYTGYKAAAPEWISVKDRLPEEESGLLLVYNSRLKKIGTSYWSEGIWCGGTWPVTSQFITYWMPIPELPKEEE